MEKEVINEVINKEDSFFIIKEDSGPFDVLDQISTKLKKFGLKVNLINEKEGDIYEYKYEIIPIE